MFGLAFGVCMQYFSVAEVFIWQWSASVFYVRWSLTARGGHMQLGCESYLQIR